MGRQSWVVKENFLGKLIYVKLLLVKYLKLISSKLSQIIFNFSQPNKGFLIKIFFHFSRQFKAIEIFSFWWKYTFLKRHTKEHGHIWYNHNTISFRHIFLAITVYTSRIWHLPPTMLFNRWDCSKNVVIHLSWHLEAEVFLFLENQFLLFASK